MELYKKYRPLRLKDVVGNRPLLVSISEMMRTKTLPQVLLFTGPAGCGKTTLARIIQANLDCNVLDRREINASSIRGIDSIRELEHECSLCPIATSRVWILDEVHKWTPDAQSAALKLLEDTPPNVYFFLCTTNPEKLSKALRSRCTQLAVQSLSCPEIVKVLSRVLGAHGCMVDVEFLELIADNADGSARSALVLANRLRHMPTDQWAEAISTEGAAAPNVIELCRSLMSANTKWGRVRDILKTIEADPESVRWMVLGYFNTVLLKSGTARPYQIIQCFSEPFFNTKKAGLTASCWEVVHPEVD